MAKYESSSFYANTTSRDFYLDLLKLPDVSFDASDEELAIPSAYDRRPDLWAHELYGDVNFWWIFALRNKDVLLDPVEDFTAGKVIKVPSKNALTRLV